MLTVKLHCTFVTTKEALTRSEGIATLWSGVII